MSQDPACSQLDRELGMELVRSLERSNQAGQILGKRLLFVFLVMRMSMVLGKSYITACTKMTLAPQVEFCFLTRGEGIST